MPSIDGRDCIGEKRLKRVKIGSRVEGPVHNYGCNAESSHVAPRSGARRVGSTTKSQEVMPEREMPCGGEGLMDEFMRVVAVGGRRGGGCISRLGARSATDRTIAAAHHIKTPVHLFPRRESPFRDENALG